MMFGGALPMLYPVCFLAVTIQLFIERFCLAYYYKQPPHYNDILSKDTLAILKWSIVANLFVNYWMFSNQQMFSNSVNE